MKKTLTAVIAVLSMVFCTVNAKAKKEKAPKEKKAKAKKGAAEPFVITDGCGVIGYFTFDEDEVADNEIIDHSGAGMNASTGALDGTVLEAGKNGNAIQFNGDDEYITIDNEMLSGDGATFAAWVNPKAWMDWMRVFDIGDGNACDAWCGMDAESKMLRMDVIGPGEPAKILSPLPPAGKWTHIAATFGNGKAALYVNGKLAQKLPCTTKTSDIGATVSGIFIGRSNWAADPLFNGAMDEVLVANRAFTDAEIASVYAGVKVPAAE